MNLWLSSYIITGNETLIFNHSNIPNIQTHSIVASVSIIYSDSVNDEAGAFCLRQALVTDPFDNLDTQPEKKNIDLQGHGHNHHHTCHKEIISLPWNLNPNISSAFYRSPTMFGSFQLTILRLLRVTIKRINGNRQVYARGIK